MGTKKLGGEAQFSKWITQIASLKHISFSEPSGLLCVQFRPENSKCEILDCTAEKHHEKLDQSCREPFPEGGKAAEAFQSLFSHIDGKIRDGYGDDGCGRKVVSTEKLILTQYSPYLWYETYHDVMVWGNL
ncbi:hypothetical protein GEV33_008192 [Tenebrio molitor]|uniref:Uncharacterized protein n=1 Tax=Tenebrio molitor TaxID=7067 RepID=A0A8J6LAD5_TENMO|nr:hypothetical protein GEV33_008192 [Tenebrio molitor]